MEYLTAGKTADKWNLSIRMIQPFCTQGRIPGAERFGRSWALPDTAEKPAEPRKEKNGGGECDR